MADFLAAAYPGGLVFFDEEAERSARAKAEQLADEVSRSSVTELPLTYRLDLKGVERIFPEEFQRGGTLSLNRWYVLRCEAFLYINNDYGLTSRPAVAPFEPPVEDLATLKLARTGRRLESLEEFEEIVDFFYRMGRVPLDAWNQWGELLRRASLVEGDLLIVEDSIRWTLFNDVIPVEPRPDWEPYHVSYWVHVLLYDRRTREISHSAFVVGRPDCPSGYDIIAEPQVRLQAPMVGALERDRPYARIVMPQDGAALGRQPRRRTETLEGIASHARDLLSPDRMLWSSDRDGLLGHGPRIEVVLRDLSSGPHELSFRVCDNRDRCDEAIRSVTVP